jgi:uncharacterized protein with FMN-binding domain
MKKRYEFRPVKVFIVLFILSIIVGVSIQQFVEENPVTDMTVKSATEKAAKITLKDSIYLKNKNRYTARDVIAGVENYEPLGSPPLPHN